MSDTKAINGAFNAVLNASSWASCLARIRADLIPKVCGLADENAALRAGIERAIVDLSFPREGVAPPLLAGVLQGDMIAARNALQTALRCVEGGQRNG